MFRVQKIAHPRAPGSIVQHRPLSLEETAHLTEEVLGGEVS